MICDQALGGAGPLKLPRTMPVFEVMLVLQMMKC